MTIKYRFEKIEEARKNYYVSYTPPIADINFASLHVVFSDNPPDEPFIRKIMESELKYWIDRYPVPLMVTSFDTNDNSLISGDYYEASLVGWIDRNQNAIITSWKCRDLDEAIKQFPTEKEWPEIYTDIPYETAKEIEEKNAAARKELVKGVRILKVMLILWLAVLPAGWAVFITLGPAWVGGAIFVYTLWKSFNIACRIWGGKAPTNKAGREAEIARKKDHYYYHCERNPVGFEKLRTENFAEDLKKENLKEFDTIMSKKIT